MNKKLGINCDLCNDELFENVPFFSTECVIEHETLVGDYEIEDCEPIFICCESCSTKYSISNFIKNEVLAIANAVQHTKSKISAINNRYDCCLCDKRIPNQTQILTIASGFETFSGNTISQEDVVLDTVVCIDCEKNLNIKKQIESKVRQFINKNKIKKPILTVVK